MRKIRLNNRLYELVNEPNRSASNLQFNVVKGENTFESIIDNADGNDIIDVYEDDEKVGTYKGYSELFVASYVKGNDSISIELINNDIIQQIEDLNISIDELDEDIEGVKQDVANITPITLTKTAYIDDTEIAFEDVPEGALSVYTIDSEGKPIDFEMNRENNVVTLTFEPLEHVTNITLTIR